MDPFEFRRLLREIPFTPLRVVMSSGESYVIRHPEMAVVTEECLDILSEVQDIEKDIPRHVAWCDWNNMAHVEPVRRNGRPRAGKKRVSKKAR